jgi:hypothetical protein
MQPPINSLHMSTWLLLHATSSGLSPAGLCLLVFSFVGQLAQDSVEARRYSNLPKLSAPALSATDATKPTRQQLYACQCPPLKLQPTHVAATPCASHSCTCVTLLNTSGGIPLTFPFLMDLCLVGRAPNRVLMSHWPAAQSSLVVLLPRYSEAAMQDTMYFTCTHSVHQQHPFWKPCSSNRAPQPPSSRPAMAASLQGRVLLNHDSCRLCLTLRLSSGVSARLSVPPPSANDCFAPLKFTLFQYLTQKGTHTALILLVQVAHGSRTFWVAACNDRIQQAPRGQHNIIIS